MLEIPSGINSTSPATSENRGRPAPGLVEFAHICDEKWPSTEQTVCQAPLSGLGAGGWVSTQTSLTTTLLVQPVPLDTEMVSSLKFRLY